MDYIIEHHGITKQRWGHRRYQNPDGTYTEEGKARRRKDYVPYSEWSEDAKKHAELSRKDPKEMSNAELDAYASRQQKLDKYNELRPSDIAKYATMGLLAATAITKAISTVHGLYSASKTIKNDGIEFVNGFKKLKK